MREQMLEFRSGTGTNADRPELRLTDVMSRMPYTIGSEASVSAVSEAMSKHRIHHLPVLECGRLVGLINDRLVASAKSLDADFLLTAKDIMSSDPILLHEDSDVETALRGMLDGRHDAAIVVHPESMNVIGVFTWRDAVRLLLDQNELN